VASKTHMVKFLSSKDQVADILTKPLVPHLNVRPPTLRSRGRIEDNDVIASTCLHLKAK